MLVNAIEDISRCRLLPDYRSRYTLHFRLGEGDATERVQADDVGYMITYR